MSAVKRSGNPSAKVVSINRHEINSTNAPELKKLFDLDVLPLAVCRIDIEIKGVPTAVVNAIRRTAIDEVLGYALKIPADGFDVKLTTERFMTQQFLNTNINAIRLKTQIPTDVISTLRLGLDIENTGVKTKKVYSGDLYAIAGKLPADLYNPTIQIATVEPGMRLVINGIYISSGYGRDNANYNVACCARYSHLDLETYTPEELNLPGGIAVESCDYKLPSIITNPQHHLLTMVLPAVGRDTSVIHGVLSDVCLTIKEKFKLIAVSVRDDSASRGGIKLTVKQLLDGSNEGILQIPGESYTVGELLRRTVFDIDEAANGVESGLNIVYKVITRENMLSIKIIHPSQEIHEIITDAVEKIISTFDNIQQGVKQM
jgi:hypothetical protein